MEEKTRKRRVPRRPNRPLLVLVCLVVAVIVAANAVIFGFAVPHADVASAFLTDPDFTDQEVIDAREATAQLTEEVEGEAIVLLDNDGTLPLAAGKVNVFGSTAGNNFSYGGTGGSGGGDSSQNVTFYQGLENAGLEPNPELLSFYETHAKDPTTFWNVGVDWNLYELPLSDYDPAVLEDARAYSDTAIVVITRKGGEGTDLPLDMAGLEGSEAGRSYLELTPSEEELLDMARTSYDKVVVVLNSPNAMELGFLEDEGVDAAIWVGTPGARGANAIGKVLTGAVNPSGKTVDTFPYEVESAPSYYNFGAYDYPNTSYTNTALTAGLGDTETGTNPYHYVEYAEGIYVGYRYYETAAADGFIDYDATVQYPFGYGLSYTTFDQTLDEVTDDGTTVTARVTVTNTGDVAGKQVAEIYASAPYTPGGIEKSEVVLAGFAKTKLLEPGESQTLEVAFPKEDLASYDYTGAKAEGGAYVLEAGEYEIRLQTDSHTVVDSESISVAEDVIYDDAHDGKRASDDVAATNQFDDASTGAGLTYVSRADWAGTVPTERSPQSKDATLEQIEAIAGAPIEDPADVEDVTTGAHNGLTLADMKGLDYDDPQWDALLDQLDPGETEVMLGNAGWLTTSVQSVGKPALVECDGPNGVNNLLGLYSGTQMTGQCMLGYTWNVELAARFGDLMAKEGRSYGVAGLYAPGANLHRSPFGGRNFEYVSEDPLLTGKVVAAEIASIQDNGLYCYLKHFAVNDQETHRGDGGLVTWLNEQALRELYLRPFEIAVKDANLSGMMTAFNRVGATPAAESSALLTTVLRDEWGFRGAVITDCTMAASTCDINRALRAGNDLQLNFLQEYQLSDETKNTPAGRQAMRRAAHNVLYMVANSDALDTAFLPDFKSAVTTPTIAIDVVAVALLALYLWRRHVGMVRWREAGKPQGWLSRKVFGEKGAKQ